MKAINIYKTSKTDAKIQACGDKLPMATRRGSLASVWEKSGGQTGI